ncbi:hypothetical protein AB4259_10650 [Vibrio amylolyticus]|uniref:hypothetical protein n=1 Tax=Vibrio amylolyticus TaxID=2847292 RepID=UPI00354F6B14
MLMKEVVSNVYTLLDREYLTLGEEVLQVDDGKIIADTVYSAVSPGTEKAAWLGKTPLRPCKQYPRLQGYCNLARVRSVGKDVEGIEVGDYILTHQSHRSVVVVNEQDILVRFSQLDEEHQKDVCLTYLFHLGYSALLKSEFFPGHKVAIIGCGALGYTTASLLSSFGAKPTIVTSKTELAVDKFSGDSVSVLNKKEALAPSANSGFDIIINTSDSWEDYVIGLELLRAGGVCVLLGFPGRGESSPDFNPLMSRLMYDKQLSVRYAGYVCESEQNMQDVRFTLKRNMNYLASLILDKKLSTSALNQLVMPFSELSDLYQLLVKRETNSLTGILKWS